MKASIVIFAIFAVFWISVVISALRVSVKRRHDEEEKWLAEQEAQMLRNREGKP